MVVSGSRISEEQFLNFPYREPKESCDIRARMICTDIPITAPRIRTPESLARVRVHAAVLHRVWPYPVLGKGKACTAEVHGP